MKTFLWAAFLVFAISAVTYAGALPQTTPQLPNYQSWPFKNSWNIENPDTKEIVGIVYEHVKERGVFFPNLVREVFRAGFDKPETIYWSDVQRDLNGNPLRMWLREYQLKNGVYILVSEEFTSFIGELPDFKNMPQKPF